MEKQKKPRISVLMTVYNGERYLKQTIDSVLNQTFRDFEFIIVNDGSTDNTKKIIKHIMKKDKRIFYLENKKNKGFWNLHNVVNKGMKECTGKYIARIDADDLCYPDRLKVQYRYLENNPDIFMIGSSFDIIDKGGKKIKTVKKFPYPSIMYKMYIGFSNSFCHSSIFFRNEGRIEYPFANEHLFYFFLLTIGKKIKNISDILVKYRINPEGAMSENADLSQNPYKHLYTDKDRA